MAHDLRLRQAQQAGLRGAPGAAQAVFEFARTLQIDAALTGGALFEYQGLVHVQARWPVKVSGAIRGQRPTLRPSAQCHHR